MILVALKKKSDGALLSTLPELSECYDNWKDHVTGLIAREQTQVECGGGTGEVIYKIQLILPCVHRYFCSTEKNL